MHIAIAGNIGAGKTTLTKLLAKISTGKLNLKQLTTILIWMIFIMIWRNGLSIFKFIFRKSIQSGKGNQRKW